VADLTSRILGGNAARLYGLDPRRGGNQRPTDPDDGSRDAADQGGTSL
jgi:hypothetical protein